MSINRLKNKIIREIRSLPVPKEERMRWHEYERTVNHYTNMLPCEAQDWLSRTTAAHFRV